MIDEVFTPGMTAMAAPVMRGTTAIGVISIAGPRVRLTEERMLLLGPALLDAAAELAASSNASAQFKDQRLGRL
jgi:DNA-binding IclR family transcriptional regulator